MIEQSFKLPCGSVLKNRIAKAAMTERIADSTNNVTERHFELYDRWAATGAGLLITGNVMVDNRHLESAGNVCVLTCDQDRLRRWVDVVHRHETHLWMQISHAGRQTSKFNTIHPQAPSAVRLKTLGLFGTPKALTNAEIEDLIERFATAGTIARQCGFDGIQIHAAHGYLISQFLSPLTNIRNDQWGGSLENRSRFLIEIVRLTRKRLGPNFPISVKLNSADFQRGGFDETDALRVVRMLTDEGIDLLEISGGTYEKSAFLLKNSEVPGQKESTRRREAYFIDFAERVRQVSDIPLMVTGGFRTLDLCNEALRSGMVDIIGMARPFITDLDSIQSFIKGNVPKLQNKIVRTGVPLFENAAEGGMYARQIIGLAVGKQFKPGMNPLWSAAYLVLYEMLKAMRRRRQS